MRRPRRPRRGPVQVAGVDHRRGRFLVYSQSLTVDGFWWATGQFEALDETTSDRELGEAVQRMLDASMENLRSPDVRSAPSPLADMYAAAGARTYAAYVTGTRHVGVERRGGTIEAMPSVNEGRRGGFVGQPSLAASVTGGEAGQLGALVRAAVDRAT